MKKVAVRASSVFLVVFALGIASLGSVRNTRADVGYLVSGGQTYGGVKSFVFGNGESYTRGIELDGRIDSYTPVNFSQSLSYDVVSRITALPATAKPAQAQTYVRDALRLTSAVNASTAHSYTYDLLGNRLAHTVDAATTTYQYPPTSNRLASVTVTAPNRSRVVHEQRDKKMKNNGGGS